MIEIQLGVTDWLSDSSSVILTETKKWLMIKGIACHLKYALSYPFPPYLSITLEEPLSIKHVVQAIESRMKAEFLFHESSPASLVIYFFFARTLLKCTH